MKTTPPGIELKRRPASVKAAANPGEFEAIVSVFGNVDDGGDRVMPGAFARTLTEHADTGRLIPVVWSHLWDIPPIAEPLEIRETDAGLFVRARLFVGDDEDHPVARQVYTGMKAGVLSEFSFAFRVRGFRFVEEDGEQIRELEDLELFEVGPTLVGMNRDTSLLDVASAAGKHGTAPKHLQTAHDALVKAGARCEIASDDGEASRDAPGSIDREHVIRLLSRPRTREMST